jgi:crotonobetainyl-CoA:carnitine CoA-transferase CaiB-like acyl-CoA transferase
MGHTLTLEAQALWKILVVGLVLGAGLPTVFALGIRSLALGEGGSAEVATADGTAARPHPIGLVLAGICFLIVIIAVVLALVYLVVTGQGKVLDFSNVWPSIHAKS